MEKEIIILKQKLANANDFIKDIASLLEIDTDGIGFDGLQLSIDDFDEAICALGGNPDTIKKYEIDFNGNIKTEIEITNNKPKIIRAMNGYGTTIIVNAVTITEIDL